jgi:hypothetical protein
VKDNQPSSFLPFSCSYIFVENRDQPKSVRAGYNYLSKYIPGMRENKMAESGSLLVKERREMPIISRVQRNHGLEHATLHVLSQRYPKRSLAGHSDTRGFWVIGDVPIEDVYEAVEEALDRLRKGEKHLAVHRNCGTNYVTSGVLAGLAAGVAMFGVGKRMRDKLERLPFAMFVATLALIFSQPLGYLLQERVTTSAEPGNLQVVEIVASRRGRMKAHRISTRN